jgi:hypothetical protein
MQAGLALGSNSEGTSDATRQSIHLGHSAMATHSIDYLNARRASANARRWQGGGRTDRVVNPVDQRAQDAELDAGELLHEQVRLVFADFRAWFAESTNALRQGNIADDAQSIPF